MAIIRKQQDSDLSELKRLLLRLGKMSSNAVSSSVWALEQRNADTAMSVIEGDDALDELAHHIDASCMNFAARYQPLGEDLRTVSSIMHMAINLERIGDYGVNIARATIDLEGKALIKPLMDIPRMAAILSEMLDKILSIFDAGNVEDASAVFAMDQQIDALEKQIIRELLTLVMERVDRLEQAFLLMNIARILERAGDHATNITERVIYIYTGKTVKAADYKPPKPPYAPRGKNLGGEV